MYIKDRLTNESLAKKMLSSYELVNYAIRLAKNMVEVEREARVVTPGIINVSYLILEEISQGKDAFEEPRPKVDVSVAHADIVGPDEEKKPRRKLLKTLRTTRPLEKEPEEIDMSAPDEDEDEGLSSED